MILQRCHQGGLQSRQMTQLILQGCHVCAKLTELPLQAMQNGNDVMQNELSSVRTGRITHQNGDTETTPLMPKPQ